MEDDPLIYLLLALANVGVFGVFLVAYTYVILRRRKGALWHWLADIEIFALGLLILFAAVFVYQGLPLARQLLGDSYWGRDSFRLVASSGLLVAGLTMNYALWKTSRTPPRSKLRRRDDYTK